MNLPAMWKYCDMVHCPWHPPRLDVFLGVFLGPDLSCRPQHLSKEGYPLYMGVKKSREQNNETSGETEKKATTEITPTLEDQKLSEMNEVESKEKKTEDDMDSNDVKGLLTYQISNSKANNKLQIQK